MASCSVLCGHRAQGGCQHHSGAEMLFPSPQPTPSTLPGDPPQSAITSSPAQGDSIYR